MPRNVVLVLLTIAFLIMALPLPQVFLSGVMILFFLLDMFFIIGKKQLPDGNYMRWMCLFFLFCLLSILWSIQVKFSVLVIFTRLLPVYSVTLFISLYVHSYQKLEIVLKAFYISAFIFFLYFITLIDMTIIGEGRITSLVEDEDAAEGFNSNYIAGRMVFAVYTGYLLFWKLRSNNILLKSFHFFASIVLGFFVFVSGSRTSLGLFLLPLLIFFLLKKGNLFIKVLGIIVLISAIFLVTMKIPFFYDVIGTRIEDAFIIVNGADDGNEDTSRLILVNLGIDWFLQKPLLGYGINCFRMLSYNSPWFSDYYYAHNNYVELMVDVGMIGLIIYYWFYLSFFRSYKKMDLGKRDVGKVVIVLLVVMMFLDMFWVGYYNNMSQLLLCIIFTILHIEQKNAVLSTSCISNDNND